MRRRKQRRAKNKTIKKLKIKKKTSKNKMKNCQKLNRNVSTPLSCTIATALLQNKSPENKIKKEYKKVNEK